MRLKLIILINIIEGIPNWLLILIYKAYCVLWICKLKLILSFIIIKLFINFLHQIYIVSIKVILLLIIIIFFSNTVQIWIAILVFIFNLLLALKIIDLLNILIFLVWKAILITKIWFKLFFVNVLLIIFVWTSIANIINEIWYLLLINLYYLSVQWVVCFILFKHIWEFFPQVLQILTAWV